MKKLRGTSTQLGITAVAAIILILIVLFFATKKDEEPIRVGFIGPLSGYAKNAGSDVKAAIDSAVAEINANGGINGKKLEVVAEDGKCSYSDAQEATRRLFANKVPIIIGGVCETETRGAASVIGPLNEVQPEDKKVLLFAPCSSNSPESTEDALRLHPFDGASYGAASATLAYANLGTKTAAILRCEQAWCSELAAGFKKKFTGLGGSVVFERIAVSTGKNENEFVKEVEPKLVELKDSKASLAYIVGDAPYSALTSVLMGKFNVSDVTIVTTGSLADPQLVQNERFFQALSPGNVMAVVLPSTPDCGPEARDAMMRLASSIGKVGTGDSNSIKNDFLTNGTSGQMEYVLMTASKLGSGSSSSS